MDCGDLLETMFENFIGHAIPPKDLSPDMLELQRRLIKQVFLRGLLYYSNVVHDGGKATEKAIEVLTPENIDKYIRESEE